MKQYCRYCANCVQVDDDIYYCERSTATFEGAKARRANKCKNFVFNPIDVFDLERKYKPREKKSTIADGKLSIFDEVKNEEAI